jgi:hypothetical protein
VVWLRLYSTNAVLGYLFGGCDSTVSRWVLLLVLEGAGQDTMRQPDPGRQRRKQLDELLAGIPELVVVIDSFEQKVQRPPDKDKQQRSFSGKKKQHTLNSQVAVDEETGQIVDVSDGVPGPTPDIHLLDQSDLLEHLADGLAVLGDAAYQDIDKRHPRGHSPRKKPRNKPRPTADEAYYHAFSCRRIIVENTINRARRYQAITQPDRHHRQLHAPVSGRSLVSSTARSRPGCLPDPVWGKGRSSLSPCSECYLMYIRHFVFMTCQQRG